MPWLLDSWEHYQIFVAERTVRHHQIQPYEGNNEVRGHKGSQRAQLGGRCSFLCTLQT